MTQPFKVSNNPMQISRHILAYLLHVRPSAYREELYVIFFNLKKGRGGGKLIAHKADEQ